jgi:hypothetical protein
MERARSFFFASASPLEVGRKLLPAHCGPFRPQVSCSYRELFERAVKQILKVQDWRIVVVYLKITLSAVTQRVACVPRSPNKRD